VIQLQILKNFFSPEELLYIIEYTDPLLITKKTRQAVDLRLNPKSLEDRTVDAVRSFAQENNIHLSEGDCLEKIKVSKYSPGQYCHIHTDSAPFNDGTKVWSTCRKVSFITLLNDDFQGGRLFFSGLTSSLNADMEDPDFELIDGREYYGPDIKPGDLVIFPSWYTHQVTEVTSGIRRSLQGWLLGPYWT